MIMKKYLLFLLLLATVFTVRGQSFQSFIDRLTALPVYQRQAVVDSFMNAGHTFPYTENETLVHFIYNAPAQSMAIAGDATGWNPALIMLTFQGTTFWYFSCNYESDARLDYKFVKDGSDWILDPLNPRTCVGGYGPNSELRMPAYVSPPEIVYYNNIPHGTVKDTLFNSTILGNSRTVKVYLPPDYSTSQSEYPVILFHDGLEYITLGSALNVLDYLIAHRLITPVIAVFVPPVDRTAEYAGSKIDIFTGFIVTELMPDIDSRYRTRNDPSVRATIGASNGGNISLYIGLNHPENFGRIAAQSSNVQPVISSGFSTPPKKNLELYIDIGKYDIPVLIPMVNNLAQILTTNGYTHIYHLWHEGHSWGNWKAHLALPLMQFFPLSAGIAEQQNNSSPTLDLVGPNPFRDSTRVKFSAPQGTSVTISLFDISGKKLETLFSGKAGSSSETKTLYIQGHPTGTYILTLQVGTQQASQKINIIK